MKNHIKLCLILIFTLLIGNISMECTNCTHVCSNECTYIDGVCQHICEDPVDLLNKWEPGT